MRGQRRTIGFLASAGVLATVAALAIPSTVLAANPSGKVSPSKNLTNNKTINVTGKGWPANDSLVIVECDSSASGLTDINACNTNNIVSASANAKGVVSKTQFVFATGAIGDGTCNAGQSCFIVLTEPSQTGLHALMKVTVSKKA